MRASRTPIAGAGAGLPAAQNGPPPTRSAAMVTEREVSDATRDRGREAVGRGLPGSGRQRYPGLHAGRQDWLASIRAVNHKPDSHAECEGKLKPADSGNSTRGSVASDCGPARGARCIGKPDPAPAKAGLRQPAFAGVWPHFPRRKTGAKSLMLTRAVRDQRDESRKDTGS